MSSDLYRYGSSTAQTVTITSDANRDLGLVDVVEVQEALDISNDYARELGRVVVDNDRLDTDLSAALNGDGTALRTVLQAAVSIEDRQGNQIDPATDGGLQAIQDRLTDTVASEATLASVDGSAADTAGALTNSAGVAHGQHATNTADTAESITGGAASPVGAGKAVAVQAIPGNSGTIYVGDATVDSSTGYPLVGGQVVTLAVEDAANIYVTAPTTGDAVAWIVESDA